MKKLLLVLGILAGIFFIYAFYSGGKSYEHEKIFTAHGPEDIALDNSDSGHPRIFISCSKRKGDNRYGKIQTYDINQGTVKDMSLVNYENAEAFRPHGIYFLEGDSINQLYVISHEMINDKKVDKILKFQVDGNDLIFTGKEWTSDVYSLFEAINDLHVQPDGTIYCSNPSGKLSVSGVPSGVLMIKEDVVKEAQLNLRYPNGVYASDEYLYVAAVQDEGVYRYSINSDGGIGEGSKKRISSIKGGDNITYNGDELYVAHHPSLLKFMLHARLGLKSPSLISATNLKTGESKAVYGPSAADISASSTAILFDDHLYISQVFEDYIIKVPLRSLDL